MGLIPTLSTLHLGSVKIVKVGTCDSYRDMLLTIDDFEIK